MALPILSHLYIRAKAGGWIAAYDGWQFRTKLELAAQLAGWLAEQLGKRRPPNWVVTDGAYAKRPFLRPVLALGGTVVSRPRRAAALGSLPPVVPPGRRGRGRPRIYGTRRIDLAQRAAQTRGWQTGTFSLSGRLVQYCSARDLMAIFNFFIFMDLQKGTGDARTVRSRYRRKHLWIVTCYYKIL